MLDIITSFATATAVLVAAWQIRESRKYSVTAFEDSLDKQYREIIMQIPVDALIGKNITPKDHAYARENVFNYLDLCNEQIYLRRKKRISKSRWVDWNEGIKGNLQKPIFQEVWAEVKKEAPGEFTDLTKLESNSFDSDPAQWKKSRS